MAPKPIVILVHGSWHTPAHYTKLIATLEVSGLETTCPKLPSANNAIPPTGTLSTDTAHIRSIITQYADQSRPIILLMHSYGGVVGSNAVQSLLHCQRLAQGLQGGVVHMVYLTAFVIPAQTAIATSFGGKQPPWIDEDVEKGIIHMQDWRTAFYSDCSEDEIEVIPARVACPAAVATDPIEYTPYEHVGKGLDATYIVCRGDQNLKPEMQEKMAELLGESKRIEDCDSGHCAMIKGYKRISEITNGAWTFSQTRLEG